MTYFRFFVGLTALLAATTVMSEEDEDAVLEPFVVTATRTRVPLSQSLGPTLVITREEIERSLAADIAEILRFHAGLDIGRNGGPGQTTSLFIRGTDSNHALVLIDGVKMNPGTIGGAALQNISPDTVERIEIVKGPRSSLYGSEAVGGVVNIITRGGDGRQYVTGSLTAGQYDTRQATAGFSQPFSNGDLGINVSWYETNGYPTRTNDTTDRGHDNISVNLQGSLRVGALDVTMRHWQSAGTTEYSDFFLTPVDQDYENRTTALEVSANPSTSWKTRANLSYALDDIEQNQGADFVTTSRYSLDWQNDFDVADRHVLVAGLYLSEQDTQSMSFGLGFDETISVSAIYSEALLFFDHQDLMLAGRFTDHETFGGEPTWNVGYGLDLTLLTRLTAGIGTAFRAPDSTDLFGFGGNPDLDPETSALFEVSVSHRPADNHRLTLGIFRSEIDDLIEFVVTDPVTFAGENQNIEEALIDGVEASYTFDGRLWNVHVEAVHQDPRNKSTGQRLFRRSENSVSLNLTRRVGLHELALDILATGDRLDFGFPDPVRLDGYVLANLRGRYALTNSWSLQASLENILDEDYELASGFNTTGRGVYLRVNYKSR